MKTKIEEIKYSQLTPFERKQVREEFIRLQKNKCFYCKKSLLNEPPLKITNMKIDWDNFPDNFLKYPIHLQHNHLTDEVEGAVHSYCNAVMWQYEGR